MPRWVPAIALALCLLVGSSPAQAAYDHASGAPSGAGEYKASITGVQATTDIVLVLDNSGSMANQFPASLNTKWQDTVAATETFVEQLGTSGLFAHGGKVGLVLFSNGVERELAPTSDEAAIAQKLAEGGPTANSCITCGLKRAAELLSGIPNSGGHKRLIYVLADGANTVTPPTVAEAVAAANAAGAVRRVIGLGSGAEGQELEALDSDGAVTYVESRQALGTAYSAEPTSFPGATNVSWTFHLWPGVTPSAATASTGTATISGSDVVWTIPALGAETANLTFHGSRTAGGGCEAYGFLKGTSFSDSEGDAPPVLPPEVIAEPACLPRPPLISLPRPKNCWHGKSLAVTVRPPSGVGVTKTVIKLTGHKAKTYKGKSAVGKIKVTGLPKGSYKVKVIVTLADGSTQSATRSYRACASKRKHKH